MLESIEKSSWYGVQYVSGPDDLFIKTFWTLAHSNKKAINACKINRDVYSIVTIKKQTRKKQYLI